MTSPLEIEAISGVLRTFGLTPHGHDHPVEPTTGIAMRARGACPDCDKAHDEAARAIIDAQRMLTAVAPERPVTDVPLPLNPVLVDGMTWFAAEQGLVVLGWIRADTLPTDPVEKIAPRTEGWQPEPGWMEMRVEIGETEMTDILQMDQMGAMFRTAEILVERGERTS